MKNKFYENWRMYVAKNNSEESDEPRSYGEQLFPVFICSSIGMFIIHVLSFGGAVIWPAYGFEVLFGSLIIGLFTGSCILIIFEVIKFTLVDTVFENYFKSGIKSPGMAFVAGIMITGSIVSSTNGIPMAVFRLSPDAQMVSIADIEEKYKLKESDIVGKWGPAVDSAQSRKDAFWTSNAKYYSREDRIRLSRDTLIRQPYNMLVKDLKEANDDLKAELKLLASSMRLEIDEAKEENKKRATNHEIKKSKAGDIGFWFMLILELCYIALVCWRRYYKDRSKNELRGLDEEASTNENQTNGGTQGGQNKGKVVHIKTEEEDHGEDEHTQKQAVAKKETKPNKIGYKQHGSVFVPDGSSTPHVNYKTKKGTWAEYSSAKLKRMAKKEEKRILERQLEGKPTDKTWYNELLSLASKVDAFKPNS